jgi:protein-L-isoaspartate(D-aspartate) O-methyltransferase
MSSILLVTAFALSSLLALAACGPWKAARPSGASPAPRGDDDRREERERMLATQLVPRGVGDERVLAALRRVPRHRFVPADQAANAYEDRPLPIGLGQTISQPFIVGFMSQTLQLRGHERVLEIGCGSGYQSAVLGELAREVWSIEILEPLAERARATLAELGYTNVHVRSGDGYLGWPEHAPFDAILVAAAPEHVPQPLVDQLAIGGRMLLPLGGAEQELVVLRRTESGLTRESVLPVRFVPMTGLARESGH